MRQPLIAQALLPRFVRPGDRFTADAVGRLVEGPGGAGSAAVSTDGMTVEGSREQAMMWDAQHTARLSYTVSVPLAAHDSPRVRFRLLMRRQADGVGDAVQVDLPLRPDRPVVQRRNLLALAPGATVVIPGPDAAIRPGTYATTLSVVADPALLRVLAGLSNLRASPASSTEQRIALASAELALKPIAAVASGSGLEQRIPADVAQAIASVAQTVDDNGLVSLFPQMRGRVWLTALAYDLLVQADKAGLPASPQLRDRLGQVLTQALRSDYANLIAGDALLERVMALWALQEGGKLDAAYTAELARRGTTLGTGGLALITAAIGSQDRASPLLPGLRDLLWSRVQILSRNGALAYGSLSGVGSNPLVLPSEARALAETLRAATIAVPNDPRLALLRTALLGLADANGWGSSTADAAAIRALASSFTAPPTAVTANLPEGERHGTLNATMPLLRWETRQLGPMQVRSTGAQAAAALQDSRFVPAPPGIGGSRRPSGLHGQPRAVPRPGWGRADGAALPSRRCPRT